MKFVKYDLRLFKKVPYSVLLSDSEASLASLGTTKRGLGTTKGGFRDGVPTPLCPAESSEASLASLGTASRHVIPRRSSAEGPLG